MKMGEKGERGGKRGNQMQAKKGKSGSPLSFDPVHSLLDMGMGELSVNDADGMVHGYVKGYAEMVLAAMGLGQDTGHMPSRVP